MLIRKLLGEAVVHGKKDCVTGEREEIDGMICL